MLKLKTLTHERLGCRYSMLEKLQAEGQEQYNVVFMDPDIYVVDDLQEVFDSRFGLRIHHL